MIFRFVFLLLFFSFGCVCSSASCSESYSAGLNSTQCGASASASCISSCNSYVHNYSDGRTLHYEDCTNEFDRLGTKYCDCKRVVCSDQCSSGKRRCEAQGKEWDDANCVCIDNTICDPYRAECESAGGVFSGSGSSGCCKAYCNQCKNLTQVINQKIALCCRRGLAPPDTARQCRGNPPQTCGMNWSELYTQDYEFSCRSPSVSQSAAQAYLDACFEHSSSSTDVSSSSGGGGGGSSGGGADCPECPYLESILDTLTKQKMVVTDIYMCVANPDLCHHEEEKPDTSIMPYLRPYLDSVMVIGDKEITILGRIDTSLYKLDTGFRKFVDIGMEGLQNDTLTRSVIVEGNLRVLDSLGKIRSSIISIPGAVDVLNDSTRNYFDKLAGSLGISVDSLLAHLDSIKKIIPGDILDSIAKYERLNYEKELIVDDLPLIDSLIDSTVTYFRLMHKYDSIRHVLLSDSLGSIHDAINGVAYGIGEQFGYGDTASSTLRKDVNAIGDTLSKYFNGSYVDSSSVVYGSGFVSEGERLADSLGRAVGWVGGLDGVSVDSVFINSVWETSGVDSVNDFVNDTLGGILDSLHLQLKNENDSIISSLSDSLTVWADSMIKVSPFVSFDSLIYSTIGAKIPNSDQCPEDCQSWSLDLPRFGLINYTVDFGLCLGRVPLGGLNVLGFLRLIIRLVIVWTCISIVMWNFSQRKM